MHSCHIKRRHLKRFRWFKEREKFTQVRSMHAQSVATQCAVLLQIHESYQLFDRPLLLSSVWYLCLSDGETLLYTYSPRIPTLDIQTQATPGWHPFLRASVSFPECVEYFQSNFYYWWCSCLWASPPLLQSCSYLSPDRSNPSSRGLLMDPALLLAPLGSLINARRLPRGRKLWQQFAVHWNATQMQKQRPSLLKRK